MLVQTDQASHIRAGHSRGSNHFQHTYSAFMIVDVEWIISVMKQLIPLCGTNKGFFSPPKVDGHRGIVLPLLHVLFPPLL